MNASDILKKYFGYDSFREGQEPIIQSILSGRDALAFMWFLFLSFLGNRD